MLSILSTEQVKRLIQFKPKQKRQYRPAVLALLLVDTGLRIDEALTLRVEHVDFDMVASSSG